MEEGWDEDKAEIDAMGCIGGIAGGKRYAQGIFRNNKKSRI